MRATTSWPSWSTVSASARTMTSYGPVTSSAVATPVMPEISEATAAALPTSVWMRMYACTTACPFVATGWVEVGTCHATYPSWGSECSDWEATLRPEPPRDAETVAEVGEFNLIHRVTTGRAQPETTILGPGDDAAVVAVPDGR